jgi:erythromycin esterase-like protein
MPVAAPSRVTETIVQAAHLISDIADYDGLIERAGRAQVVLIGEASHGTHEFYADRAEITKRLIAEHGFRIVVLEADWPDALRVHRYVTGRTREANAREALGDFRRFPAWMWRNTVMIEFVDWLKSWNDRVSNPNARTGIFGMDLYSMHSSIDAVLGYLDQVDPDAAHRARGRYACFDFFGEDPQAYGIATVRDQAESCEDEVVAQLTELRTKYGELISRDGQVAEDEFFYAEQNARLVANAERYYRSMFRGRDQSWNLRDAHMAETLVALVNHFDHGRCKVVVWAHNSHLGNARATEMSERDEWNVGQLTRERFGDRVYGIGFSTYSGSVTAARDWGDPAECCHVRPALPGSYESLLHKTYLPSFYLDLRCENPANKLLREPRLQRAIGVIYRPETERWSHYFGTCLSRQFDALIHLDRTHALEPLEPGSEWTRCDLPETYPEGL